MRTSRADTLERLRAGPIDLLVRCDSEANLNDFVVCSFIQRIFGGPDLSEIAVERELTLLKEPKLP